MNARPFTRARLIAALAEAVGRDGTLVMPSWSGSDDEPFRPDRTPADADLGVVADTFRRPDVRRSAEILRDPLPLPPHVPESPAGRVWELDGQILLLGVNHDADTTIHLAEILGGAPYRVQKHCTVLEDGRPRRIEYGENDHCCRRFVLADEWLRRARLQTEGRIGNAAARLARSRDVVDTVVARLRDDPLLFLHDESVGCEECDEARASVDGPAAT